MTAPVIETKRLTLRPYRLDDFEAYAAMVTSPRAKYMQPGLTRDEAWSWFANDVASWELFGFGCVMIEDTASGDTVGSTGVTQGIAFPEPELGWLLYEGCEGKGYATEAATALRAHVCATCGLASLVSYVSPENTASIAVAKRLGAEEDPKAARPVGETALDTLVFRHPVGAV